MKYKAIRHCGFDGNWLDRNNQSSLIGWTDFISCFPPYMQDLLEDVSKSVDGFSSKFEVAAWVRCVEFFGLSLSTITLSIALVVFCKYPILLNSRTRIHRHLFSVLLVQSITTLLIYTDQETFQILVKYNLACIFVYTFYEFLTSISFAFMLIEGLNLRRIVSRNALRPQISYRVLIASGYLYPIINTIIWFTHSSYRYGWNTNNRCWFGYNLDSYYWLLQGPRLVVLIANLMIMLLVIRTVVKKLAQNDTTELQRIKKAVRATVFLMPLLGITNFISMTDAPLKDTTLSFALWAFFAYFLRSLQGFFVSYVHCFRNNEVVDVVSRHIRAVNERNDQAVRYHANNTECEIIRREDDTRLEPTEPQECNDAELNVTENQQPIAAKEIKPLNEVVIDIEECESFETNEIIVHRCDDPSESDGHTKST